MASVSPNSFICCHVFSSSSSDGDPEATLAEDVVGDLKDVAVLNDRIVGGEVVTLDANGPGALRVRPLPSPHSSIRLEI